MKYLRPGKAVWLLILFTCWSIPTTTSALDLGLKAQDVPNDAGKAIAIQWDTVPRPPDTQIYAFLLQRSESADGKWQNIAPLEITTKNFVDDGSANGTNALQPNKDYWYRLRVDYALSKLINDSLFVDTLNRVAITSNVVGPVRAIPSWINVKHIVVILLIALFFGSILYLTNQAKTGKKFFVRRIAGLDAIDEAIGRATEMGKPVLFAPGSQGVDNIQTIAAMIILTEVARRTADYDVPIIVPLMSSFVVPVAEEAVKSGATNAGRPEAYVPDNIRFLSEEQFAYTAGCSGIMLREKPAANLFMGAFFAESLILSEVGFSTGAIQIAGTSNVHQLPFFVVACDYTLIGEEFFAASSYISGDPGLLGTLRGTDWMKVLAMSLIVIGSILETMGVTQFTRLFEM
ncbi:MAG: fibronectin type III domain-containing protein [bacterium]|nr:fibronectin type III domain-containing protein [bacterium]